MCFKPILLNKKHTLATYYVPVETLNLCSKGFSFHLWSVFHLLHLFSVIMGSMITSGFQDVAPSDVFTV